MGRYVADYAKKNLGGKIKIGLLEMLDAPHTAIRGVEFKKVLEAQLGKSNITYVFEQDFGQTRESANNIVNNNIAKPMDVIWCAVDNAAQGARIALKNNGIEGTKLISSAWGNEPFNELNSKDPNYFMCVGISPYDIVKTSLMSAKAYFQGKASSLSREQNTPLAIIDQNNIGDYMKYVTKK
jgi:ABC-type sugar transport system substrate-binding protein